MKTNIDDTMNQRRLDKADETFTNRQFLNPAEVALLLKIAEARVIIQDDRNKA